MTLARRYFTARRTTPPTPPKIDGCVALTWKGGLGGENAARFLSHAGVAVGDWVHWLRPVASVYEHGSGPEDVCADHHQVGYLRWLIPPGPWELQPGDALALVERPRELGPLGTRLREPDAPPPPPPVRHQVARVELPPVRLAPPAPEVPFALAGPRGRAFKPRLFESAKAWLDEMAHAHALTQPDLLYVLCAAFATWDRQQQEQIVSYVKSGGGAQGARVAGPTGRAAHSPADKGGGS